MRGDCDASVIADVPINGKSEKEFSACFSYVVRSGSRLLFAGVARAGLDRLQIGCQIADHRADRALVVSLSIKAPPPYRHVARTVSFDVRTSVDEASDLIFGQRIAKAIREQAQVRWWSAQRACYRSVALAGQAMARCAILEIEPTSFNDRLVSVRSGAGRRYHCG